RWFVTLRPKTLVAALRLGSLWHIALRKALTSEFAFAQKPAGSTNSSVTSQAIESGLFVDKLRGSFFARLTSYSTDNCPVMPFSKFWWTASGQQGDSTMKYGQPTTV
ncbi:MAG: hypothetical protein ACRETL_01285, partial [Gammaproteobacteria bacterium]